MSRIAVVGAGYVGITTAVCLADLGNQVCVVDVDEAKVGRLQSGELTFSEPGLAEIMERNLGAGRLDFTTSYRAAIPEAEFAFIAVSTPEGEDGQADIRAVESAARSIAATIAGPLIVVNKSTVPIGTGDVVGSLLGRASVEHRVRVVSNPEFLREGSAVHDFMHPDRIVLGSHDAEAAEIVGRLYAPLGCQSVLVTDIYTAELIKYASNAFLATKISFINEIAKIADQVDADIEIVAQGMGLDPRIGRHFLSAGLGFGGSCFPKDVKALDAIGRRGAGHSGLLQAVLEINSGQRALVVDRLRDRLGSLEGAVIGLLGLAFKPDTDDMREAPSIDIATALVAAGAEVVAYDPAAMPVAKHLLPQLTYLRNPYAVAQGADALVLITEWNEFRELDFARLRRLMRRPVLIDGRNIFDPRRMRDLGFLYSGIGRS